MKKRKTEKYDRERERERERERVMGNGEEKACPVLPDE